VVAQIQGGTFFGLTAALFGDITFKDGRVEYPIPLHPGTERYFRDKGMIE
jgi:TRAP-type uncharacterized transport system substrate-binding protein